MIMAPFSLFLSTAESPERVISFAKVMIEVTVPVNFEHEQKFSSI